MAGLEAPEEWKKGELHSGDCQQDCRQSIHWPPLSLELVEHTTFAPNATAVYIMVTDFRILKAVRREAEDTVEELNTRDEDTLGQPITLGSSRIRDIYAKTSRMHFDCCDNIEVGTVADVHAASVTLEGTTDLRTRLGNGEELQWMIDSLPGLCAKLMCTLRSFPIGTPSGTGTKTDETGEKQCIFDVLEKHGCGASRHFQHHCDKSPVSDSATSFMNDASDLLYTSAVIVAGSAVSSDASFMNDTTLPATITADTMQLLRMQAETDELYHVTVVCLENMSLLLWDGMPSACEQRAGGTRGVGGGPSPRTNNGTTSETRRMGVPRGNCANPGGLAEAEGEKVIVETFIYYREAFSPVNLLLVWHVSKDSLVLSFDQPLFTQVFGVLSPYKGLSFGKETHFKIDQYSMKDQSFMTTSKQPLRRSHLFPHRLTLVPVFKLGSVTLAAHAPDYVRGVKVDLLPMCVLKVSFMDGPFLWPSVYDHHPHEYKNITWVVRRKFLKLESVTVNAALADQAAEDFAQEQEPEIWLVEDGVETLIVT
ncbi:uncharacterized protein B0H18DRAFT_962101 [Fomitopsis serialis]|uniref:uncharacterized protein n=1 Tax=Fomitopsis serialis TaxID=139415 RepID=UPI002008414C|nr:uncharacterized protein B0H18DRAFT_962101 [Neoantrodia serialis]KAH9911589.1 hypothetical protein B0H18DRAFT_962101 [Neoantrodia serialis]